MIIELILPAELQRKLDQVAAGQGCGTRSLVLEAEERFVNSDSWFADQVTRGLGLPRNTAATVAFKPDSQFASRGLKAAPQPGNKARRALLAGV